MLLLLQRFSPQPSQQRQHLLACVISLLPNILFVATIQRCIHRGGSIVRRDWLTHVGRDDSRSGRRSAYGATVDGMLDLRLSSLRDCGLIECSRRNGAVHVTTFQKPQCIKRLELRSCWIDSFRCRKLL